MSSKHKKTKSKLTTENQEKVVKEQAWNFISQLQLQPAGRLRDFMESACSASFFRHKRRRNKLFRSISILRILYNPELGQVPSEDAEFEKAAAETLYGLILVFVDAENNEEFTKRTWGATYLLAELAKCDPASFRNQCAETVIAVAVVQAWLQTFGTTDPETAYYKLCNMLSICGDYAYNTLKWYGRCE